MKNILPSSTSRIGCLIAFYLLLNGCAEHKGSYNSDEACVQKVFNQYGDFLSSAAKARAIINLNPSVAAPLGLKSIPKDIKPKTDKPVPDITLFDFSIITLQLLEFLFDHLQCAFPPLVVTDSDVLSYPATAKLPPSCENLQPGDPNRIKKKDKIAGLAKSVGRLEVRFDNTHPAVMWGTGFMIAPGIFATGCHVIESLRAQDPDLQLGDESVVVDFGQTATSTDPDSEFKVLKVFPCSEARGLDVALLLLDDPKKSLPRPLPLYLGRFEDIRAQTSVLIEYADLDHFIDPFKTELYSPYIGKGYGKFAMVDFILAKDICDDEDKFEIVLDIDSTTVGGSGAVVVDLHDDDKNKEPVVTGLHSCCSAYFPSDEGWPPLAKHHCSQLHRTFHNQDISSSSILQDPTLCSVLNNKQHRTRALDQNGNEQKLPCPETN